MGVDSLLELTTARDAADQLARMQEAAARLPELERQQAAALEASRLEENAQRAGADLSVLAQQYRSQLSASNAELADLVGRFRSVVARRKQVASLARELLVLAEHCALPSLNDQPGIDAGSAPGDRRATLVGLAQQHLIDYNLWPLLEFSGDQDQATRLVLSAINRLLPGSITTRSKF